MAVTESAIVSKHSKAMRFSTPLFLLGTLGFLSCFLFVLPFVPVVINDIGDSLLYIAAGQRLYQGEMIYRDFFEFVPPGTALVNFLMFKILGLRPWIPDLSVLLLGLGLVWLGISIAKKLMRPGLALLPSGIFLVMTRQYLCSPVHHWYSVMAAMAAVATLLEKRTPTRIAAAGLLCGLSSCFTQTRGLAVIVGLGVYLWWENRQTHESRRRLLLNEAWLLAGFVAMLVAFNGYFIWQAGPARFFWCTVVYLLKYYPKEADWNTFQVMWGEFPDYSSLRTFVVPATRWLLLFACVPLLFILFFVGYWRESRKKPPTYWQRPMLVALAGLFMLLSIAPAPNMNRMSASSLPALILLGWMLDSPRRLARAMAAAISVAVLLAAAYSVTANRPRPIGIVATPHGRIAFTDETSYEEAAWIQQHTHAGEYFYEARFPELGFYLDLRNPTPLPRMVNNGYTTTQQVADVIRGLDQHGPRYILWTRGDLDSIPSWEDPSDAHLKPLLDYLVRHYERVHMFSDADEIWEKKTDLSAGSAPSVDF